MQMQYGVGRVVVVAGAVFVMLLGSTAPAMAQLCSEDRSRILALSNLASGSRIGLSIEDVADNDAADEGDESQPSLELTPAELPKASADPIRMYLTQMAKIPLLTRDGEVAPVHRPESRRSAARAADIHNLCRKTHLPSPFSPMGCRDIYPSAPLGLPFHGRVFASFSTAGRYETALRRAGPDAGSTGRPRGGSLVLRL